MKKIYIASAIVALFTAVTSCDKYDIYPEQYGKVLMIKDAGEKSVTLYATEDQAPYYVSVMKNGHTPENPAQATLKILNEEEFKIYKEKYYGSANFQGLRVPDPKYFYLADMESLDSIENNQIVHTFQTEDDRYFGARVIFDAQKIFEWRSGLEDRARPNNKNVTDEQRQAAKDTLENFTFVVPIGLFSPNDSVNADNQYLMLTPVVENPVIGISISNDAAYIADQTRAELKDNATYRNDIIGSDFVKFTLPCPNPYGFKIKFNNSGKTDIDRFNSHHTDMVLTTLEKRDSVKNLNYRLGINNQLTDYIDFPAGKTEVWLPLEIYRNKMDFNNMEDNFATPVQLVKIECDSVTDQALKQQMKTDQVLKDKIQKVNKSFKLPANELTWKRKDGGEEKYSGYTFFVGYRVVEQPLDLDGSCIIGANDPETTEGSFDALFDDDLSTFYHSAWSDNARTDRDPKYGSYLDFQIPASNGINAVAFKFTARVHASPHGPKIIKLFYSNVESAKDREQDWQPILRSNIAEIKVSPVPGKDNSGSGQVTWLGGIKNETDWIKADKTFRYLRMSVIENSFDEKLTSIGTKTTGYWNLAELRLYGTILE